MTDNGCCEHYRSQVVRFEQELSSRIESLVSEQRQLEQVNDLRKRWVKNAATIDNLQAQLCLRKVDSYRTKLETLRLRFAVDEMQLTNMQDAYRIQQLLQATRPTHIMDAAEPTCTADDVLAALQTSVQSRQAQMEEYQDLLRESLAVLLGDKQTREQMVGQLEAAFTTHQSRLDEQFDTASNRLKQTTEEYLVLRHNRRVTQEMLAKSQQQSRHTCDVMQKQLEQLKKSSQEQLHALQQNSQKDFDKVIGVHREQVVKMEHECAALESAHRRGLCDKRRKLAAIKAEMQHWQQQYDALQMQRRHEIHTFHAELGALRKHVQRAEASALDRATAREFGGMHVPTPHQKLWHEVAAPSLRVASRSAAVATRKSKPRAPLAPSSISGSQYTRGTASSWARARQTLATPPAETKQETPSGRVSAKVKTNKAFHSRMAARQRQTDEHEREDTAPADPRQHRRFGDYLMSPIAEGQEEDSRKDYEQGDLSSEAQSIEINQQPSANGDDQSDEQENDELHFREDPNLGRIIPEHPARISLQTYESVTKEIQAIRDKMDWLLHQSESKNFLGDE